MDKKLIVSPSPHFVGRDNTADIMQDVVIALIPALFAATVYFGVRVPVIVAVCVVTCVAVEWLCRIVMKRYQTVGDFSAVVTGILLAFNLPVTIKLWMAALGSVIAIVVVKQMFGGIGHNFVNPALGARIVLLVSFGQYMVRFTAPFTNGLVDGTTTATPLDLMAQEGAALPTLKNMLLGVHGGSLGETCSIALLLGGLYLVLRQVITPTIPLAFMCTAALVSVLMGFNPVYQLLSGGLILGAVFMATDYTTSPLTERGKLIFGIGCGLITMVIRHYTPLPEGVSYAIILMNILTPHINNMTRTKSFGKK